MSAIVNPFVEIRPPDDGDGARSLVVRAPVRGRGLQLTTIDREREPDVFSVVLVHMVTGGARGPVTDLSEQERARLHEVGYLVEPHEVPTPVTYACDIEEIEEIEEIDGAGASARAARLAGQALIANPTLVHLGEQGPTRAMRGRAKLPNRFRPGRSWLTVEADRPTVRRLFSFSTPELATVAPGQPLPSGLSKTLTRQLVATGVAGSRDEMATRVDRRAAVARTLGAHLRATRTVMLEPLVDRFQLDAVRRYYRELTAEGFLRFGDEDWPQRYFSRYDPIAHYFHEQCAPVVSEIAGEPFKASFPFYAAYHPGSSLPAHRDREQCVLSVSVQIDHQPEPAGDAPWPIYLQLTDASPTTPVTMGLGAAALFYGQEVRHWRETLTEGWSSFWFLFYVPESFTGPLD